MGDVLWMSPIPYYVTILIFNIVNLGLYSAHRDTTRGEVFGAISTVITSVAGGRVGESVFPTAKFMGF